MYKLKKLELQGFKSFADRSRLEFADGVAAVVGPNGCGKSNISDAITWVLGEQSARSLRGERMADVIFNGTGKRPPTGMAEVSMTLINPEYQRGRAAGRSGAIPELEAAPANPRRSMPRHLKLVTATAMATGMAMEMATARSQAQKFTLAPAKSRLRAGCSARVKANI